MASQWRIAATEGLGFVCYRNDVCCKSSLPPSSLQTSRTAHEGFKGAKWTSHGCQPSSSFFTVLPAGFSSRSHRYAVAVLMLRPRVKFAQSSVEGLEPFQM